MTAAPRMMRDSRSWAASQVLQHAGGDAHTGGTQRGPQKCVDLPAGFRDHDVANRIAQAHRCHDAQQGHQQRRNAYRHHLPHAGFQAHFKQQQDHTNSRQHVEHDARVIFARGLTRFEKVKHLTKFGAKHPGGEERPVAQHDADGKLPQHRGQPDPFKHVTNHLGQKQNDRDRQQDFRHGV